MLFFLNSSFSGGSFTNLEISSFQSTLMLQIFISAFSQRSLTSCITSSKYLSIYLKYILSTLVGFFILKPYILGLPYLSNLNTVLPFMVWYLYWDMVLKRAVILEFIPRVVCHVMKFCFYFSTRIRILSYKSSTSSTNITNYYDRWKVCADSFFLQALHSMNLHPEWSLQQSLLGHSLLQIKGFCLKHSGLTQTS